MKTTVIRPQTDIVAIANKCERKMPRTFRYFMRRFGSDETVEQDFNSTVMFHPELLGELLDLGDWDAARYADQVATLLEP